MFEATFTITALVESNDQGQLVFHVLKHAEPVNDDRLLGKQKDETIQERVVYSKQ